MKFHSLSFNIDEKTVYDFETSNGLLLPKQYRDFLLKYNVSKPEPNGFCIAHVNEINNLTESDNVLAYFLGFACEERESRRLQWAVDIYRGRIPDEYLPLGFDYLVMHFASDWLVIKEVKSIFGITNMKAKRI